MIGGHGRDAGTHSHPSGDCLAGVRSDRPRCRPIPGRRALPRPFPAGPAAARIRLGRHRRRQGHHGLHAGRRHLPPWTLPRLRGTSIWFLPGRNRVVAQPKGVVGIISPWNYPAHLTLAPLAAAIAAGNRAMVKMSELTPSTAALLARLVAEQFPFVHGRHRRRREHAPGPGDLRARPAGDRLPDPLMRLCAASDGERELTTLSGLPWHLVPLER